MEVVVLHASPQTQQQVQCGPPLDVIVGQCHAILQLATCEDQALLVGWDAFLGVDLCLNRVDGVRSLDVQGDGLAANSLHEDLHVVVVVEVTRRGRCGGCCGGRGCGCCGCVSWWCS